MLLSLALALTLTSATVTSGCSVSVDLGGIDFECNTEPYLCPTGQICENGTCIVSGANPDAGRPLGFTRELSIAPVVTTQTNVPVMVVLDSSRVDYAVAGTAGERLFFQSESGEVLAHEIVEWNVGGTSRVWLRIPAIAQSTTVTMTYGQEPSSGATNVWSAYGLVLHFEDDFANSALPGASLLSEGGAYTGDGRFGDGFVLDGIDDAIDLGTNSTMFNGTTGATVGAWIRLFGTGSYAVMEYSNNTATSSRVLLNVRNGIPSVGVLTDETATNTESLNGPALESDRWYWLVGTIDLAASEMRLYVDGTMVAAQSLTLSAASFPPNDSALATLGRNETSLAGYFSGLIDEAHASAFAVSDSFVAIQFASMTDNLLEFGPEQEVFFVQ